METGSCSRAGSNNLLLLFGLWCPCAAGWPNREQEVRREHAHIETADSDHYIHHFVLIFRADGARRLVA
jgi:hypothetical protein